MNLESMLPRAKVPGDSLEFTDCPGAVVEVTMLHLDSRSNLICSMVLEPLATALKISQSCRYTRSLWENYGRVWTCPILFNL